MARFALLLMLGWTPGRVLAFASTRRDPVKDEAQRELDAELAAADGRQSRFMAPSGRRRSWSWLSDMSSWSWSPPTQGGQVMSTPPKSGGVASVCGTCGWANDGDCDDGGPGSDYSLCARGSDCNDCQPKSTPGIEDIDNNIMDMPPGGTPEGIEAIMEMMNNAGGYHAYGDCDRNALGHLCDGR